MNIIVETVGRRHYLIGDTYSVRDRLRAAGAKWDPARKAWWTGKRAAAEAMLRELASASASGEDAPGEDAVVAGRATYKNRTYYLAGRIIRGRTQYDDCVAPIVTRDGAKYLMYFRDGSRKFWAPISAVEVTKFYQRPQSIGGLRRYAEQARRDEEEGRDVPSDGRCRGCGAPASGCSLGEAGFVAGYCYDCQ